MRLFLFPCYPTSGKIIICKVSLSQIYRGKPFPTDTDDWFTHNVNDIFSRSALLGFRVFNFLMMDYKGDGDALSLNLDTIGNSFANQILTLLVPGPESQDLVAQLTAR